MKITLAVTAWVFAAILVRTHAYPNGAPRDSCQNLWPFHGAWLKAQPDETFPYLLDAEAVAAGDFGYIWQITLSIAADGEYFRGLIMQVRAKNDTVGAFELNSQSNPGLRVMTCNGNADTLTHSKPNDKHEFQVLWSRKNAEEYETYADEDLEVVITVLKEFEIFWSNRRIRLDNSVRDEL